MPPKRVLKDNKESITKLSTNKSTSTRNKELDMEEIFLEKERTRLMKQEDDLSKDLDGLVDNLKIAMVDGIDGKIPELETDKREMTHPIREQLLECYNDKVKMTPKRGLKDNKENITKLPTNKSTLARNKELEMEEIFLEKERTRLLKQEDDLSKDLDGLVDNLKTAIADGIDAKITELETDKREMTHPIREQLLECYNDKVKALVHHKEAQVESTYHEYMANLQALDKWSKDAIEKEKEKLENSILEKINRIERMQQKQSALKENKRSQKKP